MSFDFALKLLSLSPQQPGQLLGHILLTKLLRSISQSGKRVSDIFYRSMPNAFISLLSGQFEEYLEAIFYSDHALINWGSDPLDPVLELGEERCPSSHQAILSYLLAWDSLFTMLSSAKPSNRARLLNMLLKGPASYCFDRLMLVLGQVMPPAPLIGHLLVKPCPLDLDPRLMIQSASRTKAFLLTTGILASSKKSRRGKIKRIADLTTCNDIAWDDIFNCVDPLVQLPKRRSFAELSHLSVQLLRRLLFEFPAMIRDWHVSLSSVERSQLCVESPLAGRPGLTKQFGIQFEKMVTRHFTKFVGRLSITLVQQLALKQQDINEVQASGGLLSSLANMVGGLQSKERTISVKTRLNTLEILTTYYVSDDHSLEMIIQLPEKYPLETVQLQSGRRKGLSCDQWRSWLHQLSLFLNHQNGSILEGIKLWHRNIRKKFDGIEECAICYSIVNNKNFTLPKMQCRVCKKIFHHSCMYRWFSSSRNPTCPMCRNLFFASSFTPDSS
ncbi:Ufm1-specific protease 2 [Cichlidogyrus casuarinus]|uniref:E3 ubiquitin-protein ligase listerin n=1 Tax=Cichlidogyrus casuarinus TaxID=1844966 RepID=A0ABD2QDU8_9PLAT